MKLAICLALLLTLNPGTGLCQPRLEASLTAYCLPGRKTASGEVTFQGCIALSRSLEKALNAKFGDIVEVDGHGRFVFADRMPYPRWKYHRVDIYYPSLKKAKVFGLKRGEIRVVAHIGRDIGRDPDGDWRRAVGCGRLALARMEQVK